MKGNRFKQDNRGASLLAVLVLMVVVSLIAVVITKITIVNIEMKEVERGTKKNFYSADELMDNLRAGARELAEQSLEKAYADVLENYLTYSASGGDVQKVFATRYMDGLQKQFAENHTDPAVGASDTMDASGNVAYRVSGYDTDTVKSCIKEAADQGCYIPAADPKYEVDYGAGTFTLKGVQIRYKDAQDYETTIKTDLVFSTPKMNFSGSGQVQEFMRYALIADRQINIGAQNVTVDGNVYAGADGIYASTGGNGTIKGKTVLTRGDIVTESGSDLTVGDGGSSIWAENIRTSSAGTNGASSIHMNGNMYVADDLELAGRGSSVTLQGNYYGYNFQKNYGVQDPDSAKKAEFSSAMMVNGKSSHLDIKGLNYLLLAGRTFISRKLDASNEDILMGESISARTNQLAYYVPLEYVSGDGRSLDQKKYAAYTGISESTLKGYLNSSRQVVPYYFPGGVYYYLNFNSEKSANDFFSDYYVNNQGKTAQYANIYLDEDALIVDSNTIMTFSGDILKRAASADMLEVGTYTIAPDNWKDSSGLYWKYCSKLAVRYKSLELGLTDQGQGVTEDNVRLTSTDASGHEVIDKTVNPLFDYLIDRSAFTTEVEKHKASPTASETVYSPAADVYLIENAGTYALPATVTKGIVIATGDVKVSGQFEGMIISGGVISFDSNASVRGNKLLVSQLFTEDQKRDTPLFSQFFKGCSSLAASNISGNLDLDSYLNYDNWKKNG